MGRRRPVTVVVLLDRTFVTVDAVEVPAPIHPIARRLRELDFVPG